MKEKYSENLLFVLEVYDNYMKMIIGELLPLDNAFTKYLRNNKFKEALGLFSVH